MNSYYLAYLIHVRRQPAPLDTTAMSHDITFVHEGEFEYEIDGERFTVRAGEALYCPKGAKKIRLRVGQRLLHLAELRCQSGDAASAAVSSGDGGRR